MDDLGRNTLRWLNRVPAGLIAALLVGLSVVPWAPAGQIAAMSAQGTSEMKACVEAPTVAIRNGAIQRDLAPQSLLPLTTRPQP